MFQRCIQRLRSGQPVRIAINALGEAGLAGKVGFVYPDLDMATRTARDWCVSGLGSSARGAPNGWSDDGRGSLK